MYQKSDDSDADYVRRLLDHQGTRLQRMVYQEQDRRKNSVLNGQYPKSAIEGRAESSLIVNHQLQLN